MATLIFSLIKRVTGHFCPQQGGDSDKYVKQAKGHVSLNGLVVAGSIRIEFKLTNLSHRIRKSRKEKHQNQSVIRVVTYQNQMLTEVAQKHKGPSWRPSVSASCGGRDVSMILHYIKI